MNISYNWLKELIEIDLSAEETAAALTRVGLAVEGIHPHGDDLVFDIDLTSNRPDCLSHLGVARELRVITNSELLINNYVEDILPYPAILAQEIVRIEDPNLCHRFTARLIKNVKIGPSPEWLVNRLEAVGERSINNIADITNYVMLELGQPMHAFDLDRLAENRIVVRRARNGETIKTLDEADRKLDDTMLVICDAERPAAVAGVMGGIHSGITESTTNVLLEVAYFKRESIRQTSRKLGLTTEASYRFERGVDIRNLQNASDRAMELISELAGGEAREFIDVYPTRYEPSDVESADISAAVRRLTGLDVGRAECIRILDAMGIAADESSRRFTPPSWRHDIAIEEDLVEEVARHSGYENIGEELPPAFGAGEYQPNEERKMAVRRRLADAGFDEALSYSFIDTEFDGVIETVPGLVHETSEEPFVTLRDSVIEGAVRMRPSLLPGLLDAVRLNLNYQRRDIKLFELGKAFAADSTGGELPRERELFAIALTGGEAAEGRAVPLRELDFYDAKGLLEAALDAAGFPHAEFAPLTARHLRPGQAAEVLIEGVPVGTIGRLNEEIAADYKFKQPVYVGEIDIEAVFTQEPEPVHYRPLPRYPAVIRDVSLLVKREMSFAAIRDAVNGLKIGICRGVKFVDVYEGKGLAADERSLTIRLEYRSDERTLTDEEVDAAHKRIIDLLADEMRIGTRK
jgi:phenylalanyl-tRNA synthetase beta chain